MRLTFTTLRCQAGRHIACGGHQWDGWTLWECDCTCHGWQTPENILDILLRR